MTLRYAHLAPSHKVKAVDRLDKSINGESTIQKLYNQANIEKAEHKNGSSFERIII